MKRRNIRRLKMLVLIVGGLVFLSGVGIIAFGAYKLVARSLWGIDEAQQVADQPKPQANKNPKEICGCTKHHVRFKRDKYEVHREHAKRLNGHKVLTDKMVHTSPMLAKVHDGKGYRVDRHKLTHSEPYLHKDAYKVLQEMGRAYADQVKDTKAEASTFHISSLTRTKEQHERLRRSPAGRNASPNISAHSYGASFDIYKFDNTESCSESRKALEAVLKEFQKKGRVLLCPEGNCIHVTVRS